LMKMILLWLETTIRKTHWQREEGMALDTSAFDEAATTKTAGKKWKNPCSTKTGYGIQRVRQVKRVMIQWAAKKFLLAADCNCCDE